MISDLNARNNKLDEIFKNPENNKLFLEFINSILSDIYKQESNLHNIMIDHDEFAKICCYLTNKFFINITYCPGTILQRQAFKNIDTHFRLKLFILRKINKISNINNSGNQFNETIFFFFYSKNEIPAVVYDRVYQFSVFQNPLMQEIFKSNFISINSIFQSKLPEYNFIQNELKDLKSSNNSYNQKNKKLSTIYLYLLEELVL